MAIQSRRGPYSNFDPDKLIPGEWATVLSGDPNASDGKSIYHCFSAGNVKRMATYEDMEDNINKATDNIRNEFLEDINNATQSASAAATSANHAAQLAQQAAEDAQEVTNAIEGAVEGTIINDQMPSEVTTFSGEHIKNTYLGKSGDGSNLTITFEQATQRANIQSGDSLAVAFGKLAKFCADLDNHAFSAPVNNLTGTDPSLPLAATQGKVLSDNINLVEKAVKGFFSAETSVSLKTFCDNIFELSHNLSFFAIPFRFRIEAEWSPNSAIGWIRGMVFIQNTNYTSNEVGQMLACMGNDAWIGNILTSSGKPKIDWIKIT